MTQTSKSKEWWHTIPGMLTAVAAIITAITGLLVALNQLGLFEDQQLTATELENPDSAKRPSNISPDKVAAPIERKPVAAEAGGADVAAATGLGNAVEDGEVAAEQAVPERVTAVQPGKYSVDDPFAIQFGATYKVSLDKNEDTYFRLASPTDKAWILLDMQLASNRSGNLQSNLSILDPDGGVLAKRAIVFNEIDVGHRKKHAVSLRQATVFGLKLLNKSATAVFWLTVLDDPEAGFIPLFGEVLPQPLALQDTKSGTLDNGKYAYYAISLPKGDYKVILDFENSARRNTNLQGYLALLDSKGANQRKIIRLNEIDVSHRKIGGFSLKQDEKAIIQVYNSTHEVNYTVRILEK